MDLDNPKTNLTSPVYHENNDRTITLAGFDSRLSKEGMDGLKRDSIHAEKQYWIYYKNDKANLLVNTLFYLMGEPFG